MKYPKKVLFVITHLELGGAQRQLLCLIENLDPTRYSLYLCAGNCGYLKKEFAGIPDLEIKFIPQLIRNINPFYDLIAFLKLFRYIKKNKFDIVHTHSPKASFLGRWAAHCAGVKSILYTVHGWPQHAFMNPLLYRFYLLLERITAKVTKKIIVVSSADLAKGLREKIAPHQKFSLIHYGIEIKRLEGIYQTRKTTLPLQPLVVTISSLKPQKGLVFFLKAAQSLIKRNPSIRFIIAGDGPLRRKVGRQIEAMGLDGRVMLKGWVDDISSLLAESSLFVLASLWDGLPVALIEAVVAGVPAVVTDTGGVGDIFGHNKQGIIVAPSCDAAIEGALWNILNDYQRWSTIVLKNGEALDLKYWASERMLAQTEKLYEDLEC